jgi:hypothetical protein
VHLLIKTQYISVGLYDARIYFFKKVLNTGRRRGSGLGIKLRKIRTKKLSVFVGNTSEFSL